jgi:peptide/nickel transport system ATP-binding protein
MYAGRIVESGPVRELLRSPRHPYTVALLGSRVNEALPAGARLPVIPGSPPDCSALPPGCAFAERCAHAQPACRERQPEPVAVGPEHYARCLRVEPVRE